MVSKLEKDKGVNLEHFLHVLDGLCLTMLVALRTHTSWLEKAAAHTTKTGELAVEIH